MNDAHHRHCQPFCCCWCAARVSSLSSHTREVAPFCCWWCAARVSSYTAATHARLRRFAVGGAQHACPPTRQPPTRGCAVLLLVVCSTRVPARQPHTRGCAVLLLVVCSTRVPAQQPDTRGCAVLLVMCSTHVLAQQPDTRGCAALLLSTHSTLVAGPHTPTHTALSQRAADTDEKCVLRIFRRCYWIHQKPKTTTNRVLDQFSITNSQNTHPSSRSILHINTLPSDRYLYPHTPFHAMQQRVYLVLLSAMLLTLPMVSATCSMNAGTRLRGNASVSAESPTGMGSHGRLPCVSTPVATPRNVSITTASACCDLCNQTVANGGAWTFDTASLTCSCFPASSFTTEQRDFWISSGTE